MPRVTASPRLLPDTFCAEVVAALLPLADATRATGMRAYMRDRFDFLGIQTPARRAASLPLIRACKAWPAAHLLEAARLLWRETPRECQYVAVDLLARHHARLDMAALPALLGLAQDKSWWDSVDGLAGVVGDVVRAARRCDPDAQRDMDAALVHENLWVRRIAMLHQLGWRDEADRVRLCAYAEALAAEPDFFIRKAIGWALRDFARHDPAAVRAFLDRMGPRLSPLSRREAAKHLFVPEA